MNIEQILAECVARKKLDVSKTPKQIVDSVLDEIAGYKAAMKDRPEFGGTDAFKAEVAAK